jgi:signal transduction histidine kinase
MAVAGITYLLITLALPMPPEDAGHEAAVWIHLAVLFTAGAMLLLDGADHIRAAHRQQEEALAAERRASDLKGQFVSMVSHELRTPLTTIAGFADTLQDAWRTLDPFEVDEFLGIIRSEADHLGNLVDDVLAIPRLEAGRLLVDITDFTLRPLAFRIAELVFPAGGEREASVQVPGSTVVRADPNRVEQVLRNLLDNARKYGGDRVGIEATRNGETWTVTVADNGRGVPVEHRDRIFEQFEQISGGDNRTGSGVGLGLSVTRRLVEAMGGKVWYEPGFPVGARFCFTLPSGEAPPAPSGQAPAAQASNTPA